MGKDVQQVVARPFLIIVKDTLLSAVYLFQTGDVQNGIYLQYLLKGIQSQLDLRLDVNHILVSCSGNASATDQILPVCGVTEFVVIFPFGTVARVRQLRVGKGLHSTLQHGIILADSFFRQVFDAYLLVFVRPCVFIGAVKPISQPAVFLLASGDQFIERLLVYFIL